MKKVGILGASGKIGFMAAKALEGSCHIKGGSRNYKECFKEIEGFEWKEVDIYDSASLSNFCEDCEIILNCTGPAGVVKERVAVTAGELGITYVDTSDNILVDEEFNKALPPDSAYVGGAGYVPGLGGLLIKWISKQLFDRFDLAKCFQGGKQRFSTTALTDIVLGSLSGNGKGDSYYRNGRILKEHNLGAVKKFIPGSEQEVLMKAFLNDEMMDAARKNKVKELHWMNTVSDEKMADLVMECVQILLASDREQALSIIQEKAGEYVEQDKTEQKEWSAVVMECRGKKDDITKEYILSYEVEKEEEVCGMIAALVVKHLLNNKTENGIYWAHDIVSTDEIDQLIKNPLRGRFSLKEETKR